MVLLSSKLKITKSHSYMFSQQLAFILKDKKLNNDGIKFDYVEIIIFIFFNINRMVKHNINKSVLCLMILIYDLMYFFSTSSYFLMYFDFLNYKI